MVTSLAALTEREIYEVDPIGVDDSERSGAPLRVCAFNGRVMTKLEDVTSLAE